MVAWESGELFGWQLEQTHAGVTWDELKEVDPSRAHDAVSATSRRTASARRPAVRSCTRSSSSSRARSRSPRPPSRRESVYAARHREEVPADRRDGPPLSHLLPFGVPRHPASARSCPSRRWSSTRRLPRLGIERDDGCESSHRQRITMKARPVMASTRGCASPARLVAGVSALERRGIPTDSSNANTLTSDRAYNDEFLTPGLRSYRNAASSRRRKVSSHGGSEAPLGHSHRPR